MHYFEFIIEDFLDTAPKRYFLVSISNFVLLFYFFINRKKIKGWKSCMCYLISRNTNFCLVCVAFIYDFWLLS